jgi:hypothetical protein
MGLSIGMGALSAMPDALACVILENFKFKNYLNKIFYIRLDKPDH